MRRIFGFLLVLAMLFSMAFYCYAEEASGSGENQATTGDVYARYVGAAAPEDAPVVDGSAEVTTDDGDTISITGAPDNAVILWVVPIPASQTAAWDWFADCIGSDAAILSAFDIYFEDAQGNRMNAKDVTITIAGGNREVTVYSVATNGDAAELDSANENGEILFTANGSNYYVLAKKTDNGSVPGNEAAIEDSDGGSVEISDEHPETGDTVIIMPKPDNGKTVEKVIVTDKNGNALEVTDNGDGTYRYVQPDSDVTIEVTFKDQPAGDTSGPAVTGDNRHIGVWTAAFLLSEMAILWLVFAQKRKRENRR